MKIIPQVTKVVKEMCIKSTARNRAMIIVKEFTITYLWPSYQLSFVCFMNISFIDSFWL